MSYKRIIFLLLSFVLLASCEDRNRASGDSADNPLSECVLPQSVKAGGEVLIQWNGFPEDPDISLLAQDGTRFEVEVSVVTASGIMFRLPSSMTPGIYMVMLEQEELGTIEVTPADMPLSGLRLPSGAKQGETVTVDGTGFEEGCEVLLAGADGQEYILETLLTYSGVSVVVSADIPEGDYQMFLVQDGVRWLLSASFAVYKDVVTKTLCRVDYYSPYIGTMLLRVSWEISREEPVTLTVSEYVIDGDEESLEAYDSYICGADGYFRLDHDGFESSNDMAMTYLRNAEGTVTQSDVLIYGDDQATPFTWTYDADGFLTDISSPKRSLRSFSYQDGNLVRFRNTSFEYSDPSLVNHPYAADVVWGYMAVMEKNDPFIYVPYLLGWYTKASAQLPTVMRSPSPTGTGEDICQLSYEYNDQGYVTSMSWGDNKVTYIYK